jgi:hypothetical protein
MTSQHGWPNDSFKQFEEDPFFKDPDKWFRKAWIIKILVTVITSIVFTWCLSNILDRFNTNQNETAQRIGQMVVMGKDTLMIVDYSTLNKTYTLDSGIEISTELADKLVVKNEK